MKCIKMKIKLIIRSEEKVRLFRMWIIIEVSYCSSSYLLLRGVRCGFSLFFHPLLSWFSFATFFSFCPISLLFFFQIPRYLGFILSCLSRFFCFPAHLVIVHYQISFLLYLYLFLNYNNSSHKIVLQLLRLLNNFYI